VAETLSLQHLSKLPDNLKAKFNKVQEPMTLREQKELLRWMVDSMKLEVLSYFDENQLIQEMQEESRLNLLEELNSITNKAQE
jgi:hypothetical protein